MSSASGTAVDHLARAPQTAGYRPHIWLGSRLGQVLDSRPRFTWLEAERMRLDPQVQFGLRILRTPLYGVTWKVSADSDPVARWVDRELRRAYRQILPRAVRAYEYGICCGEVTIRPRRRPGGTGRSRDHFRLHFDGFHEIHPRDAKPWVYDRGRRANQLACLEVHGVRDAGTVYLDRRHSFWFRGEDDFGTWWGRPRMAGSYEPWLEKRGKHGAVDVRRLFYQRSFRGAMMRYPIGVTDMGSPETGQRLVSNEDISREIMEKFQAGGIIALPNIKLPDKSDYAWTWEDPKAFADVAGVLDYPKQIDKEILIGMGIPPELVEASTVGSGYSGRAIPAQVFFASMDEFSTLLIDAIDQQIIRPLVRLNFGRSGYDVIPDSLAEKVQQSASSPLPGGAPTPAIAPPLVQGKGSGPVPYDGPRGGHGVVDPTTGRVRYTSRINRSPVRMSFRATMRESRAARELWDQLDGPVMTPVTVAEPE